MEGSISGYDIIGDIHGHAKELEYILKKMGYELRDHVWTHAERKACFVGDFIDRGPEIRETLHLVRNMVDSGNALAIMGNHEYNALAFDYHHPGGGHIRRHSVKNMLQHYQTIKQFHHHDQEWDVYLDWFANLPLFLELDGLRIVHACWDDDNIAYLKKLNGPISKEILLKAHNKEDEASNVFEEVLKGKEIALPDGRYFIDKDGNKRNECRTKWWLNTDGLTYGQYLFHAPETVRDLKLTSENVALGYDSKAPTVFFGHYWLDPTVVPVWQASNVCCLDYSVAKGGALVAYRHYFDKENSNDNFVEVEAVE
jgi:predicted MPP superfamily phosphohydrolase